MLAIIAHTQYQWSVKGHLACWRRLFPRDGSTDGYDLLKSLDLWLADQQRESERERGGGEREREGERERKRERESLRLALDLLLADQAHETMDALQREVQDVKEEMASISSAIDASVDRVLAALAGAAAAPPATLLDPEGPSMARGAGGGAGPHAPEAAAREAFIDCETAACAPVRVSPPQGSGVSIVRRT